MPLYEYQCAKCGRFEVMQKADEKPLKRCPTCQKACEKLISASSFHLKGGGWYKTDYAKSSGGAASSSSSSSSSSSDTPTSKASTDAKATTPKKGSCGSGCGCH